MDQIQYFLETNERFEPLLLSSFWGRIVHIFHIIEFKTGNLNTTSQDIKG